MLLILTWQTDEKGRREEWRFDTPVGPAWALLHERSRRGTLHLYVDARSSRYIEPGRYSALGALAFWQGPEIRGTSTKLRLTAIPWEWTSVSARIVSTLKSVGLVAQIIGRTLEIRSERLSPSVLLKRAGLALFCLDPFSKTHVPPRELTALRTEAIKTLGVSGAELVELFDGGRALTAYLSPTTDRVRRVLESRRVASDEEPPEIVTRAGRTIRPTRDQWESTFDPFSRRTIDPRWLAYLPPGMCSLQSDSTEGPMEHPRSAFDYYRNQDILKVVVEYKHMGSRAIVVVCRDEASAERRFGDSKIGCVYSRNGRPFFEDPSKFLAPIREGLTRSRFWEKFSTDWVCFDGECLPWTLKSEKLLEQSHGQVLLSGEALFEEMVLAGPSLPAEERERLRSRRECFRRYRTLLDKYKAEEGSAVHFAPFQLIATEGRSYFDRTHLWQMEVLSGIVKKAGDPFFHTPYQSFSLTDQDAVSKCMVWWEELAASRAEGLVVKPLYSVPQGRRGAAQPALKCRTPEHLRLVYGPEYDLLENRWQLVERDAKRRRRQKHRRVIEQLALSVEGVQRFIDREPIGQIENCNRGLLSLEFRP